MKKFQNENEERLHQLTSDFNDKLASLEDDKKATWIAVAAYDDHALCACLHGHVNDVLTCMGIAIAAMVQDSEDPIDDAECFLKVLTDSVLATLKIREGLKESNNAKKALKTILEGIADVLDD